MLYKEERREEGGREGEGDSGENATCLGISWAPKNRWAKDTPLISEESIAEVNKSWLKKGNNKKSEETAQEQEA